jgi:hypothetical protein
MSRIESALAQKPPSNGSISFAARGSYRASGGASWKRGRAEASAGVFLPLLAANPSKNPRGI